MRPVFARHARSVAHAALNHSCQVRLPVGPAGDVANTRGQVEHSSLRDAALDERGD